MKKRILFICTLFVFLISLPSGTSAHNRSGYEEHVILPNLPTIPVEIRNESDVFLVLYLNTLCAPRIVLRPGESKVITNCFKRGLIYQGVAIFYTNEKVLDRLYIFTPVRPNEPWIFFKLFLS